MTSLDDAALLEVAETLDEPVFLVDRMWQRFWSNAAGTTLLADQREVALDRDVLLLFDAETRDRLVLEERGDAAPWRGEGRLSADGSPVAITVTPLSNGGRQGWRALRITDGSPARLLEAALSRTRELEGVARLAEVLTHEFAELLTTIGGSAELLALELSPRDAVRADVEAIRHATARAAVLTRELTRAVSTRASAPQRLDLSHAVASMVGSLKRVLGDRVTVQLSLPTEPVHARLDVSQLEGSILHLVRNARDAMPAGGTLHIATSHVAFDTPTRAVHSLIAAGCYVRVAVADNGAGMDANTALRCFDPLFSTRGSEGLGLSLVFGAITQMGGYLMCDSASGKGTTMSLIFPVAEVEALLPVAATHRLRSILVVDDEEPVRQIAARTLRRAGYRVMEAANADEALALLATDPADVDLLLTDVLMPGLNGIELAGCVTAARPQVRVLFSSGATASATDESARLPRGAAFLPKPFTPEGLHQRVRALLAD